MSRSICDAFVEEFERFLAVGGGQYLIALAGERAFGDGTDHRLVLDQQDGAGAPEFSPDRLDPHRGSGFGQAQRHSGSADR